MWDYFFNCFLGFCGVFVPQQPCGTADYGAVVHRAGGFGLQTNLGFVHAGAVIAIP